MGATKICAWCGLERPDFSGRWCEECERAHGDEFRAAREEADSGFSAGQVGEAETDRLETATPTSAPTTEPEVRGPNWEANRRRYERRKAAGQCQRCEKPAQSGRVFCAECARKKSEREKAARRRAKAGR